MKRASLQTPAWRVGINANNFADGRIFFEQRTNE
jgi:hypothetical protein